MAAKVYITGATGRLGHAVLQKIDAIPIVRRKSGLDKEVVSDFSVGDLKGILKDADVVIHLAGSRDFLDEKKSWEGNVELTRKVVEATPKSAKIIFSSTISVYGKRLAELPAKESSPLNPDTPYAKTKLEAERTVASHPSHVILRIGPIYGPQFIEYFKVLRMIEKGKMKVIGDGLNRIPFVHVSDVVHAIRNSISKGAGTYVLVGECLSQNEVYAIAARGLGVKTPKKRISLFLARLFSHIELFKAKHLGSTPVFIPEDVAVLSSDRAFNCNRARRGLGFLPKPLEEGIAEMVEEYKKHNKH